MDILLTPEQCERQAFTCRMASLKWYELKEVLQGVDLRQAERRAEEWLAARYQREFVSEVPKNKGLSNGSCVRGIVDLLVAQGSLDRRTILDKLTGEFGAPHIGKALSNPLFEQDDDGKYQVRRVYP